MAPPTVKGDLQIALRVSRELNANPRRVTASRPTSVKMETPVRKGQIRFKSAKLGLPITPVSTTSVPTAASCDSSSSTSSPLSSVQSYEDPSTYNPVNSLHSYEELRPMDPINSIPSYEEPSSHIRPQLMTLRSNTTRRKLPDNKQVSRFSTSDDHNKLFCFLTGTVGLQWIF